MAFSVLLTDDALQDLHELHDYVAFHDGPEKAADLLNKIEAVILRLQELPERGHRPPELVPLGIRDYREIFYKPYRIIYRVIGRHVYIYLIADGRRDMQALLARRLLDQ
ncbi:MAG: type II toxin-antitoxin system RelE/ParE family toxin [Alphaproteobacteria bacterium]|nr:MAG: type II toxin-antitoxin system RelE/ParE family toxin [Alphaproteobacteria bacterium]